MRYTPELKWLWSVIRSDVRLGLLYPLGCWALVRGLCSFVSPASLTGLGLSFLGHLVVIWMVIGPPILAVRTLRVASALGHRTMMKFSIAFMASGVLGWSMAIYFMGRFLEALSGPLMFVGIVGFGGLLFSKYGNFYVPSKACYQAASDGDFKKATHYFQLLIGTCDGDTQEARTVVQSLMRDNRHLLALEFVETLLNHYPNDFDVRLLQANLYTELDKPQQAALALTKVIELAPSDARFYHQRSRALSQVEGEFQAALKDLNKALELEPDNAAWLAQRASMLNRGQRHSEALADAEAAHRLDPASQAALLQISLSWMRLGHPEKADAWFQRIDRSKIS